MYFTVFSLFSIFQDPEGKVIEPIWNEGTKYPHTKYYYPTAEQSKIVNLFFCSCHHVLWKTRVMNEKCTFCFSVVKSMERALGEEEKKKQPEGRFIKVFELV